MTFTFELETWFKVVAQFTRNSVYVKNEPDRAKGRVNML